MRTLILAAAAALMAGAAGAADIPTKARPDLFAGYAAGKCGMFYGINTMGVAGALNGGPPGASIVQGDVGITLGYGCPGASPGTFWFAEGNFDFANINGSATGLSLTGPAHFEQRVGFGGPLSGMLNVIGLGSNNGLSTPSLPLLPPGVTAGTSYPFFFVALHEQDVSAMVGDARNRDWLISPGIGVGLETRLSNAVVVDTWAQWKLDSNALSVGPNKVNLGNAAVAGVTLKY